MNGATYASLIEQNAEEKRKLFTQGTGSSVATAKTFSPPEMKKYPWGYGITRRVDTSDIGADASAPPATTYDCHYFGLAGTGIFEASVLDLLDSKDEADKWIAKVALKAAGTNLTNISD